MVYAVYPSAGAGEGKPEERSFSRLKIAAKLGRAANNQERIGIAGLPRLGETGYPTWGVGRRKAS